MNRKHLRTYGERMTDIVDARTVDESENENLKFIIHKIYILRELYCLRKCSVSRPLILCTFSFHFFAILCIFRGDISETITGDLDPTWVVGF